MTDHETRTEAETEARGLVFAMMCVDRHGDLEEGEVDQAAVLLDAYAEAVRAAERARLASLVRELTGWELDRGRGWDCSCAMKREAFAEYYAPEYLATGDVLRLLTEDTAR